MKRTMLTMGLAVLMLTAFTASATACNFGCTPGYWKQEQHFDDWEVYLTTDLVSVVFECGPEVTLLAALETGGGGEYALTRHAVASLLNATKRACFDGGPSEAVIEAYCTAYDSGDPDMIEIQKDLFEGDNDQDCDLGGSGRALGRDR